jgi:hypothetical protein
MGFRSNFIIKFMTNFRTLFVALFFVMFFGNVFAISWNGVVSNHLMELGVDFSVADDDSDFFVVSELAGKSSGVYSTSSLCKKVYDDWGFNADFVSGNVNTRDDITFDVYNNKIFDFIPKKGLNSRDYRQADGEVSDCFSYAAVNYFGSDELSFSKKITYFDDVANTEKTSSVPLSDNLFYTGLCVPPDESSENTADFISSQMCVWEMQANKVPEKKFGLIAATINSVKIPFVVLSYDGSFEDSRNILFYSGVGKSIKSKSLTEFSVYPENVVCDTLSAHILDSDGVWRDVASTRKKFNKKINNKIEDEINYFELRWTENKNSLFWFDFKDCTPKKPKCLVAYNNKEFSNWISSKKVISNVPVPDLCKKLPEKIAFLRTDFGTYSTSCSNLNFSFNENVLVKNVIDWNFVTNNSTIPSLDIYFVPSSRPDNSFFKKFDLITQNYNFFLSKQDNKYDNKNIFSNFSLSVFEGIESDCQPPLPKCVTLEPVASNPVENIPEDRTNLINYMKKFDFSSKEYDCAKWSDKILLRLNTAGDGYSFICGSASGNLYISEPRSGKEWSLVLYSGKNSSVDSIGSFLGPKVVDNKNDPYGDYSVKNDSAYYDKYDFKAKISPTLDSDCEKRDCLSKVEMYFDEKYVNETKRTRFFDPTKFGTITPFDNVWMSFSFKDKDCFENTPKDSVTHPKVSESNSLGVMEVSFSNSGANSISSMIEVSAENNEKKILLNNLSSGTFECSYDSVEVVCKKKLVGRLDENMVGWSNFDFDSFAEIIEGNRNMDFNVVVIRGNETKKVTKKFNECVKLFGSDEGNERMGVESYIVSNGYKEEIKHVFSEKQKDELKDVAKNFNFLTGFVNVIKAVNTIVNGGFELSKTKRVDDYKKSLANFDFYIKKILAGKTYPFNSELGRNVGYYAHLGSLKKFADSKLFRGGIPIVSFASHITLVEKLDSLSCSSAPLKNKIYSVESGMRLSLDLPSINKLTASYLMNSLFLGIIKDFSALPLTPSLFIKSNESALNRMFLNEFPDLGDEKKIINPVLENIFDFEYEGSHQTMGEFKQSVKKMLGSVAAVATAEMVFSTDAATFVNCNKRTGDEKKDKLSFGNFGGSYLGCLSGTDLRSSRFGLRGDNSPQDYIYPDGKKYSNYSLNVWDCGYVAKTLGNFGSLDAAREFCLARNKSDGDVIYDPLDKDCGIDIKGFGLKKDPFVIEKCSQLKCLQENPTAYFTLGNDIDCTETKDWVDEKNSDSKGFKPISSFRGNFDGLGHVIKNLYIKRDGDIAFFSNLNEKFVFTDTFSQEDKLDGLKTTNISNVSFENIYFEQSGSSKKNKIAGLANNVKSASIYNVNISGKLISSNMDSSLAGFFNTAEAVDVRNSKFDGEIYGGDVSGFLNFVDWSSASGSYFRENKVYGVLHGISVTGFVHNVYGELFNNKYTKFEDCSSYATLRTNSGDTSDGKSYLAGFVGHSVNGLFYHCKYLGNVVSYKDNDLTFVGFVDTAILSDFVGEDTDSGNTCSSTMKFSNNTDTGFEYNIKNIVGFARVLDRSVVNGCTSRILEEGNIIDKGKINFLGFVNEIRPLTYEKDSISKLMNNYLIIQMNRNQDVAGDPPVVTSIDLKSIFSPTLPKESVVKNCVWYVPHTFEPSKNARQCFSNKTSIFSECCRDFPWVASPSVGDGFSGWCPQNKGPGIGTYK